MKNEVKSRKSAFPPVSLEEVLKTGHRVEAFLVRRTQQTDENALTDDIIVVLRLPWNSDVSKLRASIAERLGVVARLTPLVAMSLFGRDLRHGYFEP